MRETPWAIQPQKLDAIVEVLALRSQGVRFSDEEAAARIGALRLGAGQGKGASGIAVLPIHGTITQRPSVFSEASGGTSTMQVAQALREAVADQSIAGILLDVDSPGGTVNGVPELAAEIRTARHKKPVVAVANTLAASAAYWLASAAQELWVSPSAEVGSIGVFAIHEDWSSFYDAAGIEHTLIKAGKFKAEGVDFAPLSDEAKAAVQAQVDEFYRMFVSAVGKYRDVGVDTVREGFGQGRTVMARHAVEERMADTVGTFEDALSRVAQLAAEKATAKVAASVAPIRRLAAGSVLRVGFTTLNTLTHPIPASVRLPAPALTS